MMNNACQDKNAPKDAAAFKTANVTVKNIAWNAGAGGVAG